MPLRVLSVAFPYAPISPASVGGSEQVLSALDRALVAAGHISHVVAAKGSETAGRLWSVPAWHSRHNNGEHRALIRANVQATIDRVLADQAVDLVHMHGMDFADYLLPASLPVLVTLHLPIGWYPSSVWESSGANVHFCCVSRSQLAEPAAFLPARLRACPVVENGVGLPSWSPDAPRRNFALVMGRICPEKNQHEALQAGTLAGIPVLLAGHVFPYPDHRKYFEQRIQPLLLAPGPGHRFLGPLAPARKQQLLGRARCLLHPTRAPETSSLVAMEALACGTPVIAYASGALPTIIDDRRTGFLVDSVASMAAAISHVGSISPRDCRAAAKRRFSLDQMVGRYFDLYARLAAPSRVFA